MNKRAIKKAKEEALKLVVPKDSEIVEKAEAMIRRINKEIKRLGLKARCVPGGSVAKGTWLPNGFDVDLFVAFDPSYRGKDISELLGKALERFRPALVHGSRDYFQIVRQGVTFEVVPVLDVSSPKQAVNVTDMSPFHVKWVKGFISARPGLANEIRLAKQFCKAQGVYGAESYIGGFSGHVIDILVIYYSSFEKLVENASKWGKKEVIDFYNHYRGKALEVMNPSKTEGPLVVVDPILPERNAAAAVTMEKYEQFKKSCRRFLESPSVDFFVIKPFLPESIRSQFPGKRVVVVEAEPLDGKKDVVGGKLRKAFSFLETRIREYGFSVIESGWHWPGAGKAYFYFVFPDRAISERFLFAGPPVNEKEHADAFRKKHSRAFEKQGRLYAWKRRRVVLPEEYVSRLLKSIYFAERVKRAAVVRGFLSS